MKFKKLTRQFGIHSDRVRNLRANRAVENFYHDPRVSDVLSNGMRPYNDWTQSIYDDTNIRNDFSNINKASKLSPELERVLRQKYDEFELPRILNNYKYRPEYYIEGVKTGDNILEKNKKLGGDSIAKDLTNKFHDSIQDLSNQPDQLQLYDNAVKKVKQDLDNYNRSMDKKSLDNYNKNGKFLRYDKAEFIENPMKYSVKKNHSQSPFDNSDQHYFYDDPYNAAYFPDTDKIGMGPQNRVAGVVHHENNHRNLHQWGLASTDDGNYNTNPNKGTGKTDRDEELIKDSDYRQWQKVEKLPEEQNSNRASTMGVYLDPTSTLSNVSNQENMNRNAQNTYRYDIYGVNNPFSYEPEPRLYMDPDVRKKMEENMKKLGITDRNKDYIIKPIVTGHIG